MKHESRTYQDCMKEITIQSQKPIHEQITDMKSAGAQLLMSLDKVLGQLDTVISRLDDEFDANKVTCSIDDKEVDCDRLGEEK